MMTGSPLGRYTGVGAGSDSFFEYLLKAALLFGDDELYVIFTNVGFCVLCECCELCVKSCLLWLL